MAVSFVEFRVDNPQIKNLTKDDCSWSNSKPLLAISTTTTEYGGTVKFLNENGLPLSEINDEMPTKPGVKVSSLIWHPFAPVILVAWESGEVGVFSMKKSKTIWIESNFESQNRTRSISCINWMNDGKEIIAGMTTLFLILF